MMIVTTALEGGLLPVLIAFLIAFDIQRKLRTSSLRKFILIYWLAIAVLALSLLLNIVGILYTSGITSPFLHYLYGDHPHNYVDYLTWTIFDLLFIFYYLAFTGQFWRKLIGGPEQRDERFQLIWQTSATTTLYWLLGLLFVAGSLFDIFVNHQWPVRSLGEVLGIFVIWTLAYLYWDKRL